MFGYSQPKLNTIQTATVPLNYRQICRNILFRGKVPGTEKVWVQRGKGSGTAGEGCRYRGEGCGYTGETGVDTERGRLLVQRGKGAGTEGTVRVSEGERVRVQKVKGAGTV